jgi:hypothetical protein
MYRPATTPVICTKTGLTVAEGSPAAPDPEGTGKEAIPGSRKPSSRWGSHSQGLPSCLLGQLVPGTDRRGRDDPAGPLRKIYSQEGPSNMSPYNDRSTSQASVSLDPDRPDIFPSSRRIVHSGTQGAPLPGSTCHSVQLPRICNREEQTGPRTSSVRAIAASFDTFYIGSCCQYWGRRRYGPAR